MDDRKHEMCTRIGGFADNQVLSLVHEGFAMQLLSLILQEAENFLMAEALVLVVGTTRNLGDGEHVFPHAGRFGENLQHLLQISSSHTHASNTYFGKMTDMDTKRNRQIFPSKAFWTFLDDQGTTIRSPSPKT